MTLAIKKASFDPEFLSPTVHEPVPSVGEAKDLAQSLGQPSQRSGRHVAVLAVCWATINPAALQPTN
jgi:hypothetical protein